MTTSTNYINAFIEVADDCPAKSIAEVPPQKGGEDGKKTIANIEFELIMNNPYRYTSDDIIFEVYATRNRIANKDLVKEQEHFFSKGQPCLRSSPLTKRYGWGIHSDSVGRIALYSVQSSEYARFSKNKNLKHLKAMRSKRV